MDKWRTTEAWREVACSMTGFELTKRIIIKKLWSRFYVNLNENKYQLIYA